MCKIKTDTINIRLCNKSVRISFKRACMIIVHSIHCAKFSKKRSFNFNRYSNQKNRGRKVYRFKVNIPTYTC